jgi:PelA/Pel-15E family pectate lyase
MHLHTARRTALREFSCLLLAYVVMTCMAWPGAQARPVRWPDVLRQPDGWYGQPEARAIADSVRKYQRGSGGWPKDIDMTRPPDPAPAGARPDSTIDNGATVTQIRLLARVFDAAGDAADREAILRGIDFLLAAQYPNGGWPQFYPLRTDYSRYITFNDEAMIGVMTLLDDLVNGRARLAFVDGERRIKAAAAISRGTDLVLRAQVRVGGRLTAWCAQHDEVTLEPRKARSYEHPSLSGSETVGIVRFLMARSETDPRIPPAVDAAVAWLDAVKLQGWRLEGRADASLPGGFDRVMVRDESAPPLWARFYDIATNRPIFSGRDGVIKSSLDQIEHERRVGYAWVGDWPRALLATEYPAWRAVRGPGSSRLARRAGSGVRS